jgi:capsular polysaccharide transport system ATP-binding protein
LQYRIPSEPERPTGKPAVPNRQRAIRAVNVVKEFHTEIGIRRVLDDINFSVGPGDRLAILGRNGAGKSTMIQILADVQRPTTGYIDRGLRMSWPLALGGGFEGELTGYDNLRFIARLYNAPVQETMDFVNDFTELGSQMKMPMRFYSSGMRMRLAFALSLAIDFECFLIDEVLLVGDRKFQEKCKAAIFDDRKNRSMILAIHDRGVVIDHCNKALVLKQGRGKVFEDVQLACDVYESI